MTDRLSLKNFNALAVPLPEKRIWARLGYNRSSLTPAAQTRKIRDWINAAFLLCEPRGRAVVLPLIRCDADVVELAGGVVFHSAKLADNLRGSAQVAIMAATIGEALPRAASAKIAAGDGAAALVYDAVGTETVEAALDHIDEYCARAYRSAGRGRPRFSPGYGDWSLSAQAQFAEILSLSALGVTVTDRLQLLPEKSVTAVKGLVA
ncbi:MAG: hypothetical protein LBP75_02265 [Planctomycetota bacterium]|jgi:hypothetical protein|nr:hypothetical protein [Planctomycetota bacterium]